MLQNKGCDRVRADPGRPTTGPGLLLPGGLGTLPYNPGRLEPTRVGPRRLT
jgi:hypothetical protein